MITPKPKPETSQLNTRLQVLPGHICPGMKTGASDMWLLTLEKAAPFCGQSLLNPWAAECLGKFPELKLQL